MNEEPVYLQIAALLHGQIADGTLKPGAFTPNAEELRRTTGHGIAACQKAIRELVMRGELVRWPHRNSRPAVPGTTRDSQPITNAQALSNELCTRRSEAGLTQIELAELTGFSLTAIGHAETGRLWHSRSFWEAVDAVLNAEGKLLRRYTAFKDVPTEPAQFLPKVAVLSGKPLDAAGIAEALRKAVKIVDETLPWQDDVYDDRTELRKVAFELAFAKMMSVYEG
jgi:DNA-binding transcriptional regulator YhcF (GntR family)